MFTLHSCLEKTV